MKLDTTHLRYLTPEDWRVLTAVEIGSKNHEVIPTPLILQIANLRSGSGAHRSISTLAKANLIARVRNAKYDGYRLTYGGLDYLALHSHFQRRTLHSTGPRIGTGKESDIHIVLAPPPPSSSSPLSPKFNVPQQQQQTSTAKTKHTDQQQQILKIHRLGRISFRTIKRNRDYLRHRHSCSWMHMSRLSALKEFTFMTALHEAGFPVPKPMAWNRHTIVMSLIQGTPLYQIHHLTIEEAQGLYAELMALIVRLAGVGLIHGDFNEFNVMIEEHEEEETLKATSTADSSDEKTSTTKITLNPILIDFPQMISTSHTNAPSYFARDVNCIKRYFARRFHFTSDDPGPFFADTQKQINKENKTTKKTKKTDETGTRRRLDVEVEASGFSRKMARELEEYMESVGNEGAGDDDNDDVDDDEGDAGSDDDDDDDERCGIQAFLDTSNDGIARGKSDSPEPESLCGSGAPTTDVPGNVVSSTTGHEISVPPDNEGNSHEAIRGPLRSLSLVEAT
ncbi:MAG: hypothetical protein Q9220_002836 [cf. Caloplaca sp. 1 TL-2023]